MKTMLNRFQYCSPIKKRCFEATASVLTTIKMANGEKIQAGHAQRKGKGREMNWKDEKGKTMSLGRRSYRKHEQEEKGPGV